MEVKNSVMLVGATGSMARYLLGMLAKDNTIDEIICVARNVEQAQKDANIHLIGAHIAGHYPTILVRQCDVTNEESLAAIISETQPDVVMNCTREVAGVKYGPTSIKHLDNAYGGWTAFALSLSYKVAKAVKMSGRGEKIRLINSSYSDVVCPVLSLMPECQTPWSGIGNVGHVVPRVRMAAAKLLGTDPVHIDVQMAASHYLGTVLSRQGHVNGSPYKLRVYNRKSETFAFTLPEKIEELFKACNIPVAEGPDRNVMSASSCYRTIKEALHGSGQIFHVPGPTINGETLPGGYPVYVDETGSLQLSQSLRSFGLGSHLSEVLLVKTNIDSLKFDGIEMIDQTGVLLTEKFTEDFKKFTGMTYDHIPLDPESWDEIQKEILDKIDFSTATARLPAHHHTISIS